MISTHFKMNAVRSIMERAALYGQADKEYLTNDKLIELTSLFYPALPAIMIVRPGLAQ